MSPSSAFDTYTNVAAGAGPAPSSARAATAMSVVIPERALIARLLARGRASRVPAPGCTAVATAGAAGWRPRARILLDNRMRQRRMRHRAADGVQQPHRPQWGPGYTAFGADPVASRRRLASA